MSENIPSTVFVFRHRTMLGCNTLPGQGKVRFIQDHLEPASKRIRDKANDDLWFLSKVYGFSEDDMKRVERIKKAIEGKIP